MKLFKRVLSVVLGLEMICSFAFYLCTFADTPKNLEECCVELDKILTPEEKEKIKLSSTDELNSDLHKMATGPLGEMICRNWLHQGASGQGTELYNLLLEHGLGFGGNMEYKYTSSSIVLENYRNYLLSGKSVDSVEDLIIDHWFNFFRYFDPYFKRKVLEEQMKKWRKSKGFYEDRSVEQSKRVCTFL